MKTIKRLYGWLLSWIPEDPKKWIMCGMILVAIPGALASSWVGFPLSKGWSSLAFSMFPYVRAKHQITVTSYGVLEAVALFIGAVAYWRACWKLTYWAGAGLLLVILFGTLHLTFGDQFFLKDLLNQSAWQDASISFAQGYLPPAPVLEPSVMTNLDFDNVGQRIEAGWYFMGLAWYGAVIMAFALMICGGLGLAQRPARRAFGLTFLLVVGVTAVFMWYPMIGEHDLVMAARAEAQWHPEEAKAWYEKAMRDDRWNALDWGVHARIGALDQSLGLTDTPEYQVYRSALMVSEQKFPEAIAHCEGIAAAGGPLGAVARDRADELWVTYGLNLFEAGAYGSAAVAWQHALNNQPTMWIAAFYLTRVYLATGRDEEAAAMAQRVLDMTSDPQFIANVYSNLGDAQTRLNDLGDAHKNYGMSYFYNYVPNWRALTSLAGSVGN